MASLVAELTRFCAEGRAEASVEEAVAWEEIVSMVHAQMRSIAGASRELEDLTQSALEQVVRSAHRFEGRAAVATFTYRVCANVAMNHWRSWRRWLRRFEWHTASTPEPIFQGTREVERELRRLQSLHAALSRLTPERRIVVTLADLEQLPASRIADIVACPEGTVRSRLAQGRRDLFELLRHDALFAEETPR